MNILSNFNSSGKFSDTFSSLFSALGLCSLLRRAGFKKREGYGASVSSLLFMVLSSCFYDSNKTIYGNYTSYRKSNICTSKSSLYRFLSNCRNNWRKLILLLSERVISKVSKLSDSDRKFCFVIDDSMLERAKGKEVELMSRQYDHVSKTFVKGFNMLQIGWTDGVSFFPVNSALMSSKREENRYCEVKEEKSDPRTCGGKRRAEAVKTKTTVAVDMLEQAINSGITGDYVLMDTWFTTEPFIKQINELGLDVIGMVKPLRQRYIYNGQSLDLRKLYKAAPGKKSRDVICSVQVKTKSGIPCKIVFIRNRNCKRQFLAILSTDTSLDDDAIVRLYARRWFIETNFRAQKQYFKLGTETYARDYDNLIAFMSVSSIRYIMLEFCRRYEQDERSLGALFRNTKEQLQDIPFLTALDSLMRLFLDIPKKLEEAGLLKKGCIAKAEAIITELLGEWFNGICNFLQEILPKPST